MSGWLIPSLISLVLGQILFYQIQLKQALKSFWFLGLFYFSIFSFVRGFRIFCSLLSISFFELPLLALILFLILGGGLKGFVRFRKVLLSAPDFYFLSGLWISLIWLIWDENAHEAFGQSLGMSFYLLEGFFWSFGTALVLPVLVGIKERLDLLSPPEEFRGLPLLLVSVGFILLGFSLIPGLR